MKQYVPRNFHSRFRPSGTVQTRPRLFQVYKSKMAVVSQVRDLQRALNISNRFKLRYNVKNVLICLKLSAMRQSESKDDPYLTVYL